MLKDVYFISMEGRRDYYINNFLVREDVPLPFHIEEGKKIDFEDINPQNIISGMIKVLINEPDNENLPYYREFIFALQPNIVSDLSAVAYEAEKNEHFRDAIDMFNVLYALKPDSIDSVLNIAVCYDEFSQYLYKKGKEKEALKMDELAFDYYKIVDGFEDKPDNALYYLGRFYLLRENYEKSVEYFKEFIKATDDIDRKKEAITLLNDIINMGITDPDYKFSQELIQSEKEEEALEFIDKYIKNYPNSWNGYYLKGFVNRRLGNYNEAITDFNRALELNTESSEIYNELGLCYMDMNIFHKSEMYLAKALSKNPDDVAIISNLAILAYKRGKKEDALKYCDIILEFEPDDIQTKKLKEMFEDGSF